MKKWDYIQITLILLFGSILYTKGPKIDSLLGNKETSINKNRVYRYTREQNSRSFYYPHFRSYSRRYNQLKGSLMIKDGVNKGQKINIIMIDGHRIKINKEKKDILFRLSPGSHIIEWVSSYGGKKQFFRKKFYIDRLEQSVNLLIEGNKFSKK